MKSSSGDEQGLDLETDSKIDEEKPDYEDQRPKIESKCVSKLLYERSSVVRDEKLILRNSVVGWK